MITFLNYTEEDEGLAKRLYADLLAGGVRPWMAAYDIAPGEDEMAAETRALAQSEAVVLLLTRKFHRNPIAMELLQQAQQQGKSIVPLVADTNARIPADLPDGVKLKRRYEEGVQELIQRLPHAQAPLSEVPPQQRGNYAYHQGEFEAAVSAYQEIDSPTPESLHSTAAAHNALRQHAEALPLLDQAISLNPNETRFYLNRSLALSALGRHEDALQDDYKTLELNPDLPSVWSSHAMTLYSLGRLPEAEDAIQKAIELNPEEAHYHYQLALVALKQEAYDAAMEALEQALALEPEDSQLQSMRNMLLGKTGRAEEALAEIDRQIKKNPRQGGSYITRSLINFYLERYEEAAEDATKAIQRGQNAQPAPFFNRAIAHWRAGNSEAAQDDLLQAIALFPDLKTEAGIRENAESDLTRDAALEVLAALATAGRLPE